MAWDAAAVRAQFPILRRLVPGLGGTERRLVYMDHGASTHAPRPVVAAVTSLLEGHYANIHRGNHTLSQESTRLFDDALSGLLRSVGGDPELDCGVPGLNTTGSLDLAAHVMAGVPGATLATAAEHHSNLLPHRRRGTVRLAEVDGEGRILLEDVERQLAAGDVKLVAVTGASNVTGHMPPIHKLARLAHDAGARILVDAAQLYAHAPIAMRPHGHPEHLDFVAAAGHKAYAPLGASILVGPRDLLDAAPPYMPGGGTVDWVTDGAAAFTRSPDRHMGGTPNIVGVVAFAAAAAWLGGFGLDAVRRHEEDLVRHALRRFEALEPRGVRLLGPRRARDRLGVFSFTVAGRRHEEVAAILDHEHGIATRNGCFCAQPLIHRLLGLDDAAVASLTRAIDAGKDVARPGATRATLGIYNTRDEVDHLADAVEAIAAGRVRGTYKVGPDHVCKPVPAEEVLAQPKVRARSGRTAAGTARRPRASGR